jgi:hypothetical protein
MAWDLLFQLITCVQYNAAPATIKAAIHAGDKLQAILHVRRSSDGSCKPPL